MKTPSIPITYFAIFFVASFNLIEAKETNKEKLKKALFGQTIDVYGDDFEELDESELEKTKTNIDKIADDLSKKDNEHAAAHLREHWGEDGWKKGLSEKNPHLRNCPVCNGAARKAVEETRLSPQKGQTPNKQVGPPALQAPLHFKINGVLYIRNQFGFLYRAFFDNGQPIPNRQAEGVLWYDGQSFLGVVPGTNIVYPAKPIQ